MTREEATKRLEVVRTNALIQKANGASEYWQEEIDGTIEAIDMAIEALSERNIARDIATILENEQDMRVILQNDAVNEDTQTERRVDHDRDWIIGCIKHDGFIKTDRFDKANQIILEALSADAVQGEWKFVDHGEVAGEYFCSICGKRAEVDLYGEWILSNYCGYCGSRMKGGAE